MWLEQMLDLLQDWFYWSGMTKDVELHIMRCERCIWFKSKPQRVAMESIQATTHYNWCIWSILQSKQLRVERMFITDHVMMYAKAMVTSSQTAKCTEQALWDWFVVHYGLLESIISYQGHFSRAASFQNYASTEITYQPIPPTNKLAIWMV